MKPKFKSIHLYRLILFVVVIVSLYVTWCVTNNVLDSDASSEMVLAKHLIDTKQLFSTDWIYSTELRVVHIHLIFAPLFLIFDDWHKVRFVGTVICHIFMILSYGYMIKPLKLDKKAFYTGASLLLLPISVSYGRLVLYHGHYIPHVTISFLLLGLVLRLVEAPKKSLAFTLNLIALAALSFVNGTIGVRGLMIFHIPLLFATVVMIIAKDNSNSGFAAIKQPEYITALAVSALSSLFAGVGYFVNTTYLCSKYFVADNVKYDLGIIDNFANVSRLIYGYLHQFGLRDNVNLLSVTGVVSMLGAFCGIYLTCVAVNRFTGKYETNEKYRFPKHLLQSMFIASSVVLLCVLIFTGEENEYYYVRYFAFTILWVIPFLMCMIDDISDSWSGLNTKRLIPYAMIAILAINGVVNIGYYMGIEKFKQPYEGISFQDKNIVADLAGPVEYITSNGYTHGYSTYWMGNILTEITDGQIPITNVRYVNSKVMYYDWLVLRSQRTYQEKNFILLKADELQVFEKIPELQENCKLEYDNGTYFVYSFVDEHFLHDFIISNQ